MRFLKSLGLCALVWLTGCATTVNQAPLVTTNDPEKITLIASTTLSTQPKLAAPNAPPSQKLPSAGAGSVPQMDVNSDAIREADQRASSRAIVSLTPPKDLWERIRRGYAMPDLDNGLVHDREQWYATRPDYIFRMTERSKKYLFHIVEELELRNMPTLSLIHISEPTRPY